MKLDEKQKLTTHPEGWTCHNSLPLEVPPWGRLLCRHPRYRLDTYNLEVEASVRSWHTIRRDEGLWISDRTKSRLTCPRRSPRSVAEAECRRPKPLMPPSTSDRDSVHSADWELPLSFPVSPYWPKIGRPNTTRRVKPWWKGNNKSNIISNKF